MGTVKDILVKCISSKIANDFVKKHHYSGKVVNNSQLHFGAVLDGRLHGVMSFGPSLDKSKVIGIVEGTKWNEFVELNRMAFDAFLPKNSESRCLSVALRLIKKNCPHVKWVVTFADGMQCGDGTIYRACGFLLTGISQGSMWALPPELVSINNGPVAHRMKVQDKCSKLSEFIMSKTNGKNLTMEECAKKFGGNVMPGYMFRYVYFLDKSCRSKLTVPILPYSKIEEIGGSMYKGEKITRVKCSGCTSDTQSEGGVQIDHPALSSMEQSK